MVPPIRRDTSSFRVVGTLKPPREPGNKPQLF
jgi:hypothetical protein